MNTVKRYIFWTYERGSFHYDVMVTLILLFLFVSPRFINFGAKPVQVVPLRSSEVLVRSVGGVDNGMGGEHGRFVYEIRVQDLGDAKTDEQIRAALLRVIQPIAGSVTIESYKAVNDVKGKVVAYDATVLR
jgi:hypothetical protein